MTGKNEKRSIIDEGGVSDFTTSQLYRPADAAPPPIPTGFRVDDAIEGVDLVVDRTLDQAWKKTDFDAYVAYRATEFDTDGTPINDLEILRFTDASTFAPQDPGAARYALKSKDFHGNFSDFTTWHLGISLRETGVQDRFDTYGGVAQIGNDGELNWLRIATFEDDEAWNLDSDITIGTLNVDEGLNSLRLTPTSTLQNDASLTKALDLDAEGRFGDDDYIAFNSVLAGFGAASVSKIMISFVKTSGNFYRKTLNVLSGEVGGHILIKKSDFVKTGTLTWAEIAEVFVSVQEVPSGAHNLDVFIDDIRVVKASSLDATTYSDTGDVWVPYADDNLANNPGEWHIETDMIGQDYAMAQIDITDAAERYIIVREDRQQTDATHACQIELKYTDGQAGMLFRVRELPFVLENPVINVMFTNSSEEAVGQTHVPTSATPVFGSDASLGAYGSFIAAAADDITYASVAIGNADNETVIHCSFHVLFASTTGSSKMIWQHRIDASNLLRLIYDSTDNTWEVNATVGGSSVLGNSSAQTFSSGTDFSVTVVLNGTVGKLYVNGVEEDTFTLAGNYSTANGTFYLGSDHVGALDYIGWIYQVFAEGELVTDVEVLAWHNALLSNESGVIGRKVASPGQRDYYSLELDTSANEVSLRQHIVGFSIANIATAISFTATSDTVYHLAAIVENQDNDDDNDVDQVLIRAFISANIHDLLDGDKQVFAETITSNPVFSGGVGFRSEAANVRFGNLRAGSPQRAEWAERAAWAKVAQSVVNLAGGLPPGTAQWQIPVTGPSPFEAAYNDMLDFAGDGLTWDAANGEYDVVAADTSITINADDIQVALAANSGLQVSSGLQLGTPTTITDTTTDAVAGASHSHALDTTTFGIDAQFVVLTAEADLDNERVLTAGAGLTLTDAGAGSTITLDVGAGDGITVNADDVALTTPGTLSVSSTDTSVGNHTHAITASDAPGAAAALLKSTAAGGLTLENLTLADDLIHAGDADTLISMEDDQIVLQAGGLVMLTLTETTQDLITLGPGSGDVDIDFNGDMFLRGSDGFFGLGTNAPELLLHAKEGAAGTYPSWNATDVAVFENVAGTNTSVQILNDSVSSGQLIFSQAGGSAARFRGAIVYDHSDDSMLFMTNAGATAKVVITNGGSVGVNIATPDGKFHIRTATAGSVTAVGSANELVLENSGDCGLSILAPDASTSAVAFGSPSDTSGAWISWNFNSKLLIIGSTTASGEIRINTAAGTQAIYIDSSQNVGIRTSTAFGSGTGVLGIANASANPSTNPSGGGVLYADGGAGKWRGSSGTTTTFGPAEPHCKVCGRDFALEWENKKTGHLIVCMWCLTEKLGEEKWITRVN